MGQDLLLGTGFSLNEAETEYRELPTWTHESEPVWIREYGPTPRFREHSVFYVYQSVSKPPRGRLPWTVDNRALHSKSNPPRTFAEALAVAVAAVAERASA